MSTNLPIPPTAELSSRRSFLYRGGALAAAGALAGSVVGLPTSVSAQGLGGGTRLNFQDIQKHENDHVTFLLGALGTAARPMPVFQNLLQRNRLAFYEVSQDLENTGVGAYLAAAPAIFSPGILAAAGSIALIEGRHAGWLNTLVGDRLSTNLLGGAPSFEQPLTIQQVVDAASPFIFDLNGPPLTFSATPSPSNDIDILNFALALEFLEAAFYNANVPQFIR